ncbi:MAG: nicotinate (nicotinamide) nucleotide adenylyltransferase [Anaerolineae bacterium]|nr:nicotinate (nicotinamide) nucleotide adenylyltransferase [Anaerolineae bacterium]
MRIGVFGGTFDPPHIGHLILAMEAQDQLRLDKVLWVITPISPFKHHIHISPLEQRLELLEVALAGEAGFEISRVDVDRPPPYYAVDTMRLLRNCFANAEWFYLMGEDSLGDLPGWHQPHLLLALCDGLGVMRRPGFAANLQELEKALPGVCDKVQFFDAPLIEISAHDIRHRISRGKPFRFFVPSAVYDRIIENKYYQEDDHG